MQAIRSEPVITEYSISSLEVFDALKELFTFSLFVTFFIAGVVVDVMKNDSCQLPNTCVLFRLSA
jgi:hypothetical protein